MYDVMPKETRINVRTTPKIKRDLEVAAELRGITVSALVNSAVVKIIREEKEREPRAFIIQADASGEATLKKSQNQLTPVANRNTAVGKKADANKNAPKRKTS